MDARIRSACLVVASLLIIMLLAGCPDLFSSPGGDGKTDDEEEPQPENSPPTAEAGEDGAGTIGSVINVSGAAGDPDGDGTSCSWSFVQLPEESTLTNENIDHTGTAACSFVPDTSGIYVLELTVSDGENSATDTVSIAVSEVGKGSVSVTIEVETPEMATIAFSPSSFTLNQTTSESVTVEATGGFDVYKWYVDGEQWDQGISGDNTTVIAATDFDEPGVHTLSLIVIDDRENRFSSDAVGFAVYSE